MAKPNIGVIFPSRGMAFSATCEELLDNLEGYNYEIYFSHGKPIPLCFNEPLEKALKNKKHTHFWVVEEDMVLPRGVLKNMLGMKTGAVSCDYPMDANGKAAIFRDPDNNVIYGGTGCLLVTSRFLQKYKQPIFHTDTAWDIKVGEVVELKPRKVAGNVYGLHDVNFSLEAYKRGTPIKVANFKCGQRKLVNLGAQATNIGQHNIEPWTKLKPNKMKKPKLKFAQVLIDGKWVNVDPKSELAKMANPRYVEFVK
jgi:hypothetical protein